MELQQILFGIAFLFSATCVSWVGMKTWHQRPLSATRLARDAILASMSDGVIVVDAQSRVVEINPAARMILQQKDDAVLGKSIAEVFHRENLLDDWNAAHGPDAEFVTGIGAQRQTYELHSHPLGDLHQRAAGQLILLHDVTEQRILVEQIEQHTKELRQLAVTDELTGAATRRHLCTLGERELVRARRFNRPFSAVMFELDHLQRLNDRHGEAGRDQILKTIAAVVQNNVRDTDLLARYGEDEFVIVLPETDLSAACQVAERIRKTVAETPIKHEQELIHVTVSLGVAEITAETREFMDLLNAADNAMCKAKQAGRNRIFFADHSLARHFYFDFLPA